MTTTPLMEKQMVATLKSLLTKRHRNFDVVFLPDKPPAAVAHYLRAKRRIVIYPGHFENALDMLGAGIHETAHHVNWNLRGRLLREGSVKRHGKEFRQILGAMLDVFNYRGREHLEGRFVWSRRKPTRSPRFVKAILNKHGAASHGKGPVMKTVKELLI